MSELSNWGHCFQSGRVLWANMYMTEGMHMIAWANMSMTEGMNMTEGM